MILDELRSLATSTRNGFACWPAPYQMSPTLEDCEMLYALVRVTKPAGVLELGSGRGVSGRFIAEALRANGSGLLETVEPDDDYAEEATDLLRDVPAFVFESEELLLTESFDLVFIDSDYTRRAGDIDHWLGNEHEGLVVVHDANRKYLGLAQGRGVFLPGSDGLWIGRAAG